MGHGTRLGAQDAAEVAPELHHNSTTLKSNTHARLCTLIHMLLYEVTTALRLTSASR